MFARIFSLPGTQALIYIALSAATAISLIGMLVSAVVSVPEPQSPSIHKLRTTTYASAGPVQHINIPVVRNAAP